MRLKILIGKDFELIRNRTDEQNLFIGRFFGLVLLIELKLVQLLLRFDTRIEDKTFGGKLAVFKDFLSELDGNYTADGFETVGYRNLLGPLNEIKQVRDAMAHHLKKSNFLLSEIRQTSAYVQKKRDDLYDGGMTASTERDKCLALVAAFAFLFSVELAFLDQLFE